jgi:hypothetical protein
MFNIQKMTDVAVEAIHQFASGHQDETFYAFAIDANMLCLNSLEELSNTVTRYQLNYPADYTSEPEIQELRSNTGDWAYQGFFSLRNEHGFDDDLYDDYYNEYESDDEQTLESNYVLAMNALLEEINHRNTFTSRKKTSDFSALLVGHDY